MVISSIEGGALSAENIMKQKKLAELLFPNVTGMPEDYEVLFPKRELSENAEVTRIGPSPTGFIHLGYLYSALADERLAHRSAGRFFCALKIKKYGALQREHWPSG